MSKFYVDKHKRDGNIERILVAVGERDDNAHTLIDGKLRRPHVKTTTPSTLNINTDTEI